MTANLIRIYPGTVDLIRIAVSVVLFFFPEQKIFNIKIDVINIGILSHGKVINIKRVMLKQYQGVYRSWKSWISWKNPGI